MFIYLEAHFESINNNNNKTVYISVVIQPRLKKGVLTLLTFVAVLQVG